MTPPPIAAQYIKDGHRTQHSACDDRPRIEQELLNGVQSVYWDFVRRTHVHSLPFRRPDFAALRTSPILSEGRRQRSVYESPRSAPAGDGRLQVGVVDGHGMRPSILEAERVGHGSVRIDRLITDAAANGPGDCTLIDWHSSERDVLRKTARRDGPLLASWMARTGSRAHELQPCEIGNANDGIRAQTLPFTLT